ncbi:MAG: hypothetical protein GY952_09645 [Rhodobacteraceae bacterium]|nr:hypothetical protein [Paracoccaceae bacterium]
MTDPIIKTIDLPCSASEAFDVFVHRMSSWWPLESHAVSAADGESAQSVTVEPFVSGAIYEITHDGQRKVWGEVLEFEEGHRLTSTWHPGSNENQSTRLEVVFEDLDKGGSRLTLAHSGWEIWGDQADEKRSNYSSGWKCVLGLYDGKIQS